MKTFLPQTSGIDIDALVALLNISQNKSLLKPTLEQSLLSAAGPLSSGQILPTFTKKTPPKAEKKDKDASKRSDDKAGRHHHEQKHPQKSPAPWQKSPAPWIIMVLLLAVFCFALTRSVQYRFSLSVWGGSAPTVQRRALEPPASSTVSIVHTASYSEPSPGRKRYYHRKPHPGRRSPRRARRPEQRSPCGCSG